MAEPSPKKRLDSWKEIGVYLKRDERTAMRWARDRGMPVHHVPGPGRGSVFAYTDELDAWLNQQGAKPVAVTEGVAGTGARRSKLGIYAALLVGAVALGALALWPPRPVAPGPPVRVSLVGNTLQAWDARERLAWEFEFPEPVKHRERRDVPSLEALSRVLDMDGDGRAEVLAVVDVDAADVTGKLGGSVLYCLSDEGQLFWRYEPDVTLSFAGRSFDRPWSIFDLVVSPSGKTRNLWLAVAHHLWWPSFVAKLDSSGRAEIQFVNSGFLHSVNYLETASGGYLLAGGFNNEFDGGILAVLKEDELPAVSPQSSGSSYECDGCSERTPAFYFVFPRSELNRLQPTRNINPVTQILVRPNGVGVVTYEVADGVHTIYDFAFEPEWRLVSAAYSDGYWHLHKQLEAEGKLDHSAERCPERLHPPPVRMWREGSWHTLTVPSRYPAP